MSTDETAARLTALTEQLNALIVRAEEKFRALGFGVRARVPIPETTSWLVFGKEGREWRLLVEQASGEIGALASCSRETRIQGALCFHHMPAALRDAAAAEVVRIERVVADVGVFVDELDQ